jgi:hypothetical protein
MVQRAKCLNPACNIVQMENLKVMEIFGARFFYMPVNLLNMITNPDYINGKLPMIKVLMKRFVSNNTM